MPVKVTSAVINIVGLQLRLGNLDESLFSVLESIKISQNKTDHEAIIHCLLWLTQIISAFGNKEQEKLLLEHVIIQSHMQHLPYLFSIFTSNYAKLEATYKPLKASSNVQFSLSHDKKGTKKSKSMWSELMHTAYRKILEQY